LCGFCAGTVFSRAPESAQEVISNRLGPLTS